MTEPKPLSPLAREIAATVFGPGDSFGGPAVDDVDETLTGNPDGASAIPKDEVDELENVLVEYDDRGQLFGTSGAGAYFLAQFLLDRGWRRTDG